MQQGGARHCRISVKIRRFASKEYPDMGTEFRLQNLYTVCRHLRAASMKPKIAAKFGL